MSSDTPPDPGTRLGLINATKDFREGLEIAERDPKRMEVQFALS